MHLDYYLKTLGALVILGLASKLNGLLQSFGSILKVKYSKIPNMKAENSIPTSSAAAANSELTINDLDEYSLGIIFNKLPYRDRVGIDSVCKRWHRVSANNWWSYSEHLTITEDKDQDTFPSLRGITLNEGKNILEKVLQRRGPYLKSISLQHSYFNFKFGTIKRIVECCPKLKCLDLGMIYLNAEDWIACSNLEDLSISENDMGNLRELLGRNKRLRRLKVVSFSRQANLFDHLDPGQLEILSLNVRNFEFTAGLTDKLAESLVELNYASFSNITLRFQHLSKLKNLRTLVLDLRHATRLETQFIVDIAENCRKLERITLNIWSNNVYNKNFITSLFNLPCLMSLVLVLNQYEIPYEELHRLFRKAPQLKFFVLSSCTICQYKEDNVKPCYIHRKIRIKTTNSFARDTNHQAVIITDA